LLFKRVWQVRLFKIAALSLFLVAITKLFLIIPERSKRLDFSHYYVSSRLYLDGRNPYTTELYPLYQRYGFNPIPDINKATNPPLLILGFSIFAIFSPNTAFYLWLLFEVVSLILTLFFIHWILSKRLSSHGFIILCLLTISSPVIFFHFKYSQIQLSLLALTLAAYILLLHKKPISSCLSIMLAGMIKLYPLVLVPWFVWHNGKNWQGRLKLFLICFAFLAVVIEITGLDMWQGFYQSSPEVFNAFIGYWPGNYTIPSFLKSLIYSLYGFKPSLKLSEFVQILGFCCGFIILFITYCVCWLTINYKNERYREIEFSLLCIAMLAGSLIAWSHYLVFLIFPFTVAFLHTIQKSSNVNILILIIIGTTLNIVITFQGPYLNKHLVLKVLINYLPLYGIIGLGLILIKILRSSSKEL